MIYTMSAEKVCHSFIIGLCVFSLKLTHNCVTCIFYLTRCFVTRIQDLHSDVNKDFGTQTLKITGIFMDIN